MSKKFVFNRAKILGTIVIVLVFFGVAITIGVARQKTDSKGNGSPADEFDVIKRTRFLMDTFCTIKVPVSEQNIEKAIESAFDRMEEVDKKFNCVNPQSQLYAFNENGIPITDTEIVELIKTALKICDESEGAFDITVEPLVKLWGFFSDNPHVPAKQEIAETLKRVNYKFIRVNDNRVTKERDDVHIDLGAIAKGYSINRCVEELKVQGIKSALIEAGGQVYAFGTIKGGPWKVGVRNPRKSGIIAGLSLDNDTGISTSGDYERYVEENGQRYHHILDPKTGYSAIGVMSLSVIMQDPTLADGYSTALFVMGAEKAMKFVESRPDMDLIIVTADGKIQSTRK